MLEETKTKLVEWEGSMLVFIFRIVLALINTWIIISIVDVYLMGFAKPLLQLKLMKKSYMIEKTNRIDYQEHFDCAGYSSAFVLRNFGIKASGTEVYENIPSKMKNRYVYPKMIPRVLRTYGLQAEYRKGNLIALKNEVVKGNPVIVLIRYQVKKPWLHFVPVVGYDEDYIYLAESLLEKVNVRDTGVYNRKVPVEEFKQLWNTSMIKMPLYHHTYFAVKEP